jgi:hypothetical protein
MLVLSQTLTSQNWLVECFVDMGRIHPNADKGRQCAFDQSVVGVRLVGVLTFDANRRELCGQVRQAICKFPGSTARPRYASSNPSSELVQEGSCRKKFARLETFGKAAEDGSEKFQCLVGCASSSPQSREADSATQLQG